ncbi:hypothetical protein BCV72DRAFT_306256 [Rhizopus microsporus var. microsporus]|uniref:Uncharacterized protein n=1 Tax=Rhizopus microsporus var. microsporus TaxID=86635 RepID=A0A1X0R0R3_RHIZD|nr:hypothetical protein BCV72DRAFT_306256 [Rhizopus microsporus var. microsporus]
MKRHSTSSSSERPSKGAKLNECTVASTQEVDYSSTVNQEGTSSSSSKPGPSKKEQQKIDKQNALLKFKTEQKTLGEVKFPSCGLTTHALSTSNLCPDKKAKIPVCNSDERVENFVIETFLPRNVDNVVTEKSKRRVHTILKCKQNTCNIVWNRDIMTAHNILDIFLFALRNNNQRLDVFMRQGTSNDQPFV